MLLRKPVLEGVKVLFNNTVSAILNLNGTEKQETYSILVDFKHVSWFRLDVRTSF